MSQETETSEAKATRARALLLVAFTPESVFTHALPFDRSLIIGRGEGADIRIDAPAISRRHAAITVRAESSLSIRDLGSKNGVSAEGRRLAAEEEHAFQPGELLQLGDVSIVVQSGAPDARAEGDFDARLEALCRGEAPFTVLAARIQGPQDPAAIAGALAVFVQGRDAMRARSAGEWELILAGTRRAEAEGAAAGISFALRRGLGATVQIGLAEYPADGRAPAALRAAASARSAFAPRLRDERASASGGTVIADGDMRKLYRTIERIAASELSVLILGETGVGKEVVARAIHACSKRAEGPFLALNCAAFAETILESELFGHEKGAFTGATASKPGLLEQGDGGTVLLDELGEMPKQTQTKLLRVIEERRIRRVGGVEDRRIDVRFLAATNRKLEQEIAEGRFREDLYYRLNGFSVVVPPLRERVGEIEPLARSFAARAWEREGREGLPVFSDSVLHALREYRWPGNVRELKNAIERAVVLAGEEEITPAHLPPPMLATATAVPAEVSLYGEVEAFERARIVEALAACDGNQTKAAAKLGLTRKALLIRLDRYKIDRPRKS